MKKYVVFYRDKSYEYIEIMIKKRKICCGFVALVMVYYMFAERV